VRNDPRLLRALGEMQRAGIPRGSPEYIAKLESALMTEAFASESDQHPAQHQEEQPRYTGPVTQAPPSRDGTSHSQTGAPNGSRVVFRPPQTDLTKTIGHSHRD
jgi:hypothetical protein